jgi:hypothetical protein
MKISALLAGAAMAATAAMSAHATTFAGFSEAGSDANITWTESDTGTGGALTASAPVWFHYDVSGLSTAPIMATLTLTGTSLVAGSMSGDDVAQGGIDGTFTITTNAPGVDGATDLLNGSFTGAEISGPAFGTTASVQDSLIVGDVTYTSGLPSSDLSFGSDTSGNAFSFSGTSLSMLALNGNSPGDFSGVFTGNFASDTVSPGGAGGVPEPATWAMMLIGAGAVGGVLRRSRRMGLAAA